MDAIGDSLQIYKRCLTLPRADNEKLHVMESQSLWYIYGMSVNFSLTFPSDPEHLKICGENKNKILYIRLIIILYIRSEIRISRADNQILLTLQF